MPQYTPKTWTTGEIITAAELNAIEQAAAAAAVATDVNTTLATKVNSSTYTAGLAAKADTASLAAVAQTGSYTDLANKPTIPAALPTQTGNSGKFLTTDGSAASWGTPAGGGGGAGLPSTVVNKTTAYTAAAGDFVQADVTSAGFTVTLPAAPAVGALVAVKKVDATANTLTIAPSGGGTIDGDPTATTTTKMAGAIFEHIGSNVWRIVASMTTTGPAGPTGPTGPTGSTGPQGPGFVARGAWATTTVYAVNDIVTNGGSTYRSLTAHTSGASFTGVGANWELWASKGADGSGGTITVQDEGSALTARSTINFVGAGVTATDDAANSRTLVTIPGGGGGTVYAYPAAAPKTGMWTFTQGTGGALAQAVGQGTFAPIVVPVSFTAQTVQVEVTTAGGSGCLGRLGLYSAGTDGLPNGVLFDWGTVDCSTIGVKPITITATIPAGFLYLACAVQGTFTGNPSFRSVSGPSPQLLVPQFSIWPGASQMAGFSGSGMTAALPASPTGIDGSGVIRVGLRVA